MDTDETTLRETITNGLMNFFPGLNEETKIIKLSPLADTLNYESCLPPYYFEVTTEKYQTPTVIYRLGYEKINNIMVWRQTPLTTP